MNRNGFAKGSLLLAWDRARSEAFSELKNALSASNDTLRAIVAPDREAAEWLCEEELSAWCHDKAMLRADTLFWGAVFVLSAFLLLGGVFGSLYFNSTPVTVAFTLSCPPTALSAFFAAKFVADSFTRFRKLHTIGHARGALGVLNNSGYSVWGFGHSGLYVVHNTRNANSVPFIGFYKYEELGTPTIDHTSGQLAVELHSHSGSPIRVMILPEYESDLVNRIIDLLDKSISDRGHSLPIHSVVASR